MSGGLASPPNYNMLPFPGEIEPWAGPLQACHLLHFPPYLITLIVASVAACASFAINRHARLIWHKSSFFWGYFVGINGALDAGWILTAFVIDKSCVNDGWLALAILYGLSLFVASALVVQRVGGAWIIATALSLNPIWWVINAIYWKRKYAVFGKKIQPELTFPPASISGAIFGISNGPSGLYAVQWVPERKCWVKAPNANMGVLAGANPASPDELRLAGL